MTKILVLATLIALGLGSVSTKAREADTLNLFSGLPQLSLHSLQRDHVITPTPVLFSVRGQSPISGFDGADGGVAR
jgi:hypothetical protein